ncbi:MAG: helix-turn-helix domain-containing protein [Cyclobacteriaceae bacterium]
MTESDEIETTNFAATALQFINSTSSHIFLTGKAGTGKTTFLKNLSKHTHKQFVVVAPTGIAALNAGGVTIHSQFLLPLGTFLPDQSIPEGLRTEEGFYNQNSLARKHPLNSIRKQVLRSIDLLVIDEVSMLRADVLDAIDYRLKSARGNFNRSFGGVQLLLIGDLYQLPPVVRRNEESILSRYYSSAWFYESLALKKEGFVYIELDKIFRQVDGTFISILNNLRNNTPSAEDIEVLNGYYTSPEEIKKLEEVITLTTHNKKADEMNIRALDELESPSHFFEADIEGEFPESMYPVNSKLELKEGAQIMFIRNDSEGQMYFNGKLATVTEISDDSIEVTLAESHVQFELKREKWENKKYTLNEKTKDLDDEVIGTFSQYPVKLAWAITVHKSQGLTFDKAIIDVSQAFADGQVYVALSRLRSQDGLVLRTHINTNVINTDRQIVSFSQHHHKPERLPEVMKARQQEFVKMLLDKTFDFGSLIKEIRHALRTKMETVTLKEESMQPVLAQIANALEGEQDNTLNFRRQLFTLISKQDNSQLLERIGKGTAYYRDLITRQIKLLLLHRQEMRQHKRVKTYLNNLDEIDQLFAKRYEDLEKTQSLVDGILSGQQEFDFSKLKEKHRLEREEILKEVEMQYPQTTKTTTKKKGTKKKGGPSTYDITLEMWGKGMKIEEIARERELVPGTIEGHLAKAVQTGKLDITEFIPQEEIDHITTAIKEMPAEYSSKDLFGKLEGRYSYAKLRAVMQHVQPKTL